MSRYTVINVYTVTRVFIPVQDEAREAAADRLMVGRGAPRVADPRLDALEWGEGDCGRGTAGDARSGFAYLQ